MIFRMPLFSAIPLLTFDRNRRVFPDSTVMF